MSARLVAGLPRKTDAERAAAIVSVAHASPILDMRGIPLVSSLSPLLLDNCSADTDAAVDLGLAKVASVLPDWRILKGAVGTTKPDTSTLAPVELLSRLNTCSVEIFILIAELYY